MIYDINISELQAGFLQEEKSYFCATTDIICEKIQCYDFVRINSQDKENPKMMARTCDATQFNCADDLINHRIFYDKIRSEEVKETIANEIYKLFASNEKVFGIWLYKMYGEDKPIEEIALYVVTKHLYRSFMAFRYLPLKKKLFKYKIEEDIEKLFLEETDKVKKSLSVLKGEIDYEEYLKSIAEAYKTNPPENPELLSLLDLGFTYPSYTSSIINDIRMEIIEETENRIKEIIMAYESKSYIKIREIGYDIHNHPEMIETMNYWQKNKKSRTF